MTSTNSLLFVCHSLSAELEYSAIEAERQPSGCANFIVIMSCAISYLRADPGGLFAFSPWLYLGFTAG